MSNIQQLKELSENLIEIETELSIFFNLSVDLLIIVDHNSIILNISPSCAKILGWSRQEMIGRSYEYFVHQDDYIKTDEAKNSLYMKKLHNFKNRWRHANGLYRVIEWNASPFTSEKKSYAIGRDVTQTAEEAAAIKLAETRIRATCDIIPYGIFFTDLKGDFVYANKTWFNIVGYTLEELSGKQWGKVIYEKDRETVYSLWYKCVTENIPFDYSYRYITKDNKIVSVKTHSEQVFDGHIPLGYVGTVTTIQNAHSH